MAKTYYKTTFRVVVLSETQLPTSLSLDQIAAEITYGDCSGQVDVENQETVDGPTMARLLREQGSAPEFFQLNDEGEDVSDTLQSHRRNEGYCGKCGGDCQYDSDGNPIKATNVIGNKCEVCKVPEHDTCPLVGGCVCCDHTAKGMLRLQKHIDS